MTAPTVTGQRDFAAAAPRASLAERLRSVDNVLAVVSSVLLPFGFIVILLGWYGAARTPNLFEQIPYLISGGLVGIAMVVGAGLLYFGSWVAAAGREQRAASAELLAVMQDIRQELQARPVAVPAQSTRTRKSASNGSPRAPELVATAGGSMLHRPECAIVAERSDLHTVDPATSSLRPCRLCDPLRTSGQPVGA